MLEHEELLHLWMDEGQLHKYKAQFKMYRDKPGPFGHSMFWTEEALSVDLCHCWDNRGSGVKSFMISLTKLLHSPLLLARPSAFGGHIRIFTIRSAIGLVSGCPS